MLVLTRKRDESVIGQIDAEGLRELLAQAQATGQPVELFRVTLVKTTNAMARIGFESPGPVAIRRGELEVKDRVEHS